MSVKNTNTREYYDMEKKVSFKQTKGSHLDFSLCLKLSFSIS